MVQAPQRLLTLEQFLELPETEPASEYIDGAIIQKPMPQGEHSIIQTDLASAINLVVKPKRVARAFSELRCTFGGRSIIPDISVFLSERIPRKENGCVANAFAVAPDWAIEILSPGQSQTKIIKKILHCFDHGTQMGWLIDPTEQVVFVYQPTQAAACFEAAEAQLPVPNFAEAFQLTIGELFSWLTE